MQPQKDQNSNGETRVRVVAAPYPYLPDGYWYKGGAPRELLRRLLHPLSPKLEVRDFDLFRTEDISDEYDHTLALKYLADDYEHGHGVEVVEDLETYFNTRDLTVNEVALHNDRLRYTLQAEDDLDAHCLRPTQYVCNAEGEPLSQTFCKALRLQAEGRIVGVEWDVVFLQLPKQVRFFDLSLNLDRALRGGLSVGIEFLAILHSHKLFQESGEGEEGIVWFVREAEKRLPMKAKIFRNLPKEVLSRLVG